MNYSNYISAANESKLSKVIDQIHLYLATFDKLVCKDVIIPEISENLAKLFDIIDQFNGVLDLVDQFIGNKSSSMTLMNRDLQEFNESFMVAEKLLKGYVMYMNRFVMRTNNYTQYPKQTKKKQKTIL